MEKLGASCRLLCHRCTMTPPYLCLTWLTPFSRHSWFLVPTNLEFIDHKVTGELKRPQRVSVMDQLRLQSCQRPLSRLQRSFFKLPQPLLLLEKPAWYYFTFLYSRQRQKWRRHFSRTGSPLFTGGTVYQSSWLDPMIQKTWKPESNLNAFLQQLDGSFMLHI